MKKILFSTLLFGLLASLPAYSSVVMIDHQGETMVTSNNIERHLVINSDDETNYDIAIRPLQEFISNMDGSVQIPLEHLYINNTHQDVYLRYQEYSNIFNGVEMGGVARNLTARIRDYGIVPAGRYTILFEVQATDRETGTIASTSTFNLMFDVPIVHELNLYSEGAKIVVNAQDAFNKTKKVASENAPVVYIRSNTDWILSLDATNFGESAGNYYVRTVSGTAGVTNRLQEKALIVPGREIILARGKAPAVNEQVGVEFSVESPQNEIIPTGNYLNRVKYILREGKD